MTKLLRRLMVGVLALSAATACDDGTDPVANGTVQIRAYVDADNSADFDATADDPIQGATITLTLVGTSVTHEDTTDADGLATFDGVDLGSYSVSITLPSTLTGVTLASASEPTVQVEEDQTAEETFRYTYDPGQITGHAFLGSGAFADGDVVVPGLQVIASQGGTDVDTTETSATGSFMFAGLLPGEYTVTVEVPAYLTSTASSQTVTVTADAAATADFGFDTNVTETIAEARAAAEGDLVTVTGVAITGNTGDNAAIDNDEVWIQDSEGILVYLGSLGAQIELGDQVLVHGERDVFFDEIQIAAEAVLVTGDGTLPEPTLLSAAEFNAGEFQGGLGLLDDVYVDSVDGGEIFGSDLTTGEDVVVFVDSDAGIDAAATFTPGSVYDVVGIVSLFDGVPQLYPRMPADVVEDAPDAMTVAGARAATDGTSLEVTGVVTEDGTLEGNGFYMEDATGGIFVFTGFGNVPADLAIGDVVTVSGERAQFFDVAQIGGTVTVTETGATVAPDPAAITAANLNTGDFQGRLVVLVDVVVDSVDGSNIYVSGAEDTEPAVVRIDSDSEISAAGFTVGETYTVTGVVTNFGGTEQVKPRFEADVEGTTTVPPATTIADARAAVAGTPAEVVGVVTVDHGNFGDEIYIQDANAGIALFSSSALDGLVEGDSVLVEGDVGAFNENIQISVDAVTALGTGAVPAPTVLTGTQVNAGENPGELITLESFTVSEVEVIGDFDNHLVTGTSGDGQTVLVFVDSRSGIDSADWTVGTDYQVTGIMSFRTDDGWRIRPRKPADVMVN